MFYLIEHSGRFSISILLLQLYESLLQFLVNSSEKITNFMKTAIRKCAGQLCSDYSGNKILPADM